MSTSNDDMQPVTRKELREELAATEAKFDAKLSMLAGALLDAIKQSAQQMMRAFSEHREQQARELAATEQRVMGALGATEGRLMIELGRHTQASTEDLTARVAVIDEKYQDLPARVARLESVMPAPKRRARKS